MAQGWVSMVFLYSLRFGVDRVERVEVMPGDGR